MAKQTQERTETRGTSREIELRFRAIDEDSRSVEVIASTDSIDAHDEVVEQVWRLERFLTNPVVLWSHQSRELPIGHASNIRVEDGALKMRLHFSSEKANPRAEHVWQSILEKSLRMVSVGFRPHTVRLEMRDDLEVFVLSDNELFEISVTPIGSNPDALVEMKAKALQEFRAQGRPQPPNRSKHMDEKLFQSTLEAKDAEIKRLQADHETDKKKLAELEKTNSTLETSLTEAKAAEATAVERAEKAEAELDQQAVDQLVGKKITAAEKAEFLELRQSNRPLFDKMIANRPDLKLLDNVTGDDPAQENKATANGNGSASVAEKARAAAENAGNTSTGGSSAIAQKAREAAAQ